MNCNIIEDFKKKLYFVTATISPQLSRFSSLETLKMGQFY